MKLTINNLDLNYTIDTYGMFTGDSVEESESDYYREQYNLTGDEWRDLSFNYDHPAIVRALASASVDLLQQELVGNGDGIVKSITLEDSKSPKFYNYTTDSYRAIWDIDIFKLEAFIADHSEAFRAFVSDQWEYEYQRALDATPSDTDTLAVIKLGFYTRQAYDQESYEMSMFECESEAYYENMRLDDESQALVNSKTVTA